MGVPHDLVLKYGKASVVLTKHDADLVATLCECGKAFLLSEATNLVRKYAQEPIAMSYSSDGTPMTTKERFTVGKGHLEAQRRGGSTRE